MHNHHHLPTYTVLTTLQLSVGSHLCKCYTYGDLDVSSHNTQKAAGFPGLLTASAG